MGGVRLRETFEQLYPEQPVQPPEQPGWILAVPLPAGGRGPWTSWGAGKGDCQGVWEGAIAGAGARAEGEGTWPCLSWHEYATHQVTFN